MIARMTALCLAALACPASAQDAPATLTLELNGAEQVEGACRLSFLIENGLGADLAALSFETVVLSGAGKVSMLTLFDFRDVPQGRPRVRQFDLAGQRCDGIGRILINGAAACEGTGLAAGACIDGLKLNSRTEMELIG